jgi:hypothetical protein
VEGVGDSGRLVAVVAASSALRTSCEGLTRA